MCGFVCQKALQNITCTIGNLIYLFPKIIFAPKDLSRLCHVFFSLSLLKKGHVLLLFKIRITKFSWLCFLKDHYYYMPSKCKCTSFKISSLDQNRKAKSSMFSVLSPLKHSICSVV